MKRIYVFLSLFLLVLTSLTPCFAESQKRWFNPKMIKTYIQPNHKNTVMMEHAFAEWSRLTDDKVIFRYVNSPNAAQLKVYFVKKIDSNAFKNTDRAIGLAKMTVTDTKIVKATIYIADKTQDDIVLGKDDVYTVMLHEIGHSLGLDHSRDPRSVMYPSEHVIQEIEKSDLKQLAKIYGWAN